MIPRGMRARVADIGKYYTVSNFKNKIKMDQRIAEARARARACVTSRGGPQPRAGQAAQQLQLQLAVAWSHCRLSPLAIARGAGSRSLHVSRHDSRVNFQARPGRPIASSRARVARAPPPQVTLNDKASFPCSWGILPFLKLNKPVAKGRAAARPSMHARRRERHPDAIIGYARPLQSDACTITPRHAQWRGPGPSMSPPLQ